MTSTPVFERLWRRPLPAMAAEPLTRFCVRGVAELARRRWLLSVEGLEHVMPANDPFVLVSNHSQRPETLILNAILAFHRDGRLVHFMADWPMMLVPGVALMYRRGGVIPVFGKQPKLRSLAALEGVFQRRYPGTAWARARQWLDAGHSVGAFPEATMNRNRRRMLRGRPGAALLALEAGVQVVPAGIRFAARPPDRPIGDLEPFSVHIGPPIPSPTLDVANSDPNDMKALRVAGREFHGVLMHRISELCGKSWHPGSARRKDRMPREVGSESGDGHGTA